ncbi:MAG: DsbA family protein, partial [Carbonactinosporaceae bacterium]
VTGPAAEAHAGGVEADVESGTRSRVPGTPTFFLNGEHYTGPHDVASFSAAISAALEGPRP